MEKINDTTWIQEAQTNPKDRLDVIIGDDKSDKFEPQIKIQRWDNECNYSIRLSDKTLSKESVKEEDGKIIYNKGDVAIEFYPVEDSYKLVWFLKEKPATNKVEFTLQSKDVKFYYQPPLNEEKLEEGQTADETHIYDKDGNVIAERPENVVGSYAVYAETPKTNWKGGTEYKCGKVGHIFRPKLIDAEGKETWGNLKIENGIYSVEIPQNFLDKAVYPIKSNDTFGYTSLGESGPFYLFYYYNDTSSSAGQHFNLSKDGTLDKITLGLKLNMGTSDTVDISATIYDEDSAGADTHDLLVLIERLEVTVTTTATWNDFTGSSQELTADDLILAGIGNGEDAVDSRGGIVYDSGDARRTYNESTTGSGSYATRKAEDPWTEVDSGLSFIFSIYATYTAEAEGTNITIDGQEVKSITIDGTPVTGVTIDGAKVF